MPDRRPRGFGGVREDKERGRWIAQLDFEGRRHRRIRKTYAAALLALDELREGTKRGGTPARRPLLRDFLTEWLDTLEVRASTERGYRTYVERYLVPQLGNKRLDELIPLDVDKMSRALSKGLKPRSVAHARAILRNALTSAERARLIDYNPAELAKPVKVPNKERRILTPEQAKVLRESYRGDRLEAVYVIAMTLGLRMSELLGLRWGDVTGQAGAHIAGHPPAPPSAYPEQRGSGSSSGPAFILVRQTMHRVASKHILEAPKTERSKRDVPLTQEIAVLLERRRVEQKAEYVLTGARPDHDLVFTKAGGSPLIGSTITTAFKAHLRALELPVISFHDLRHVAASNLQARGFTLIEAQKILGHASVVTTANVYSHTDDTAMAEKMRGVAW